MEGNKGMKKNVVKKFKAYLQQEAETYGSYTEAINMMILKEKDPLTIKRLNLLKKQYKGR